MVFHYLRNGESLALDQAACNGCGECREVCPHNVFAISERKAVIRDRASCMECGACMLNCGAQAIRVNTGVGCAAAVLKGMVRGTGPACGCGGSDTQAACGA